MSVLLHDSNLQVSDILGNQRLFVSGEPLTPNDWSVIFDTHKITKVIRCLPNKLNPENNPAEALLVKKLSSTSSKIDRNQNDEDENVSENILHVPVHDMPIESILPHFARAKEFVEKNLLPSSSQQQEKEKEEERLLIFCQQGVSRSVSVTLSILVALGRKLLPENHHQNLDDDEKKSSSFMFLNEALEIVKRARPQIRPNIGFIQQLAEWEKLQFLEDNQNRNESKLFDVDEHCLQGYKKRFGGQVSEEVLREIFEKNKKTKNAAYMQQLIFDHLIEVNSSSDENDRKKVK